MVCQECGLEEGIQKKVVEDYKIPFKCTCGNIKFPFKALNGVAFLWPKPVEEKTKGGFYLPSSAQDNFKTYYAVVLSVGKGVENKRTGEFVVPEIAQGDVVLYDKSIPWGVEAMDSEGNKHPVKIANIFDINAKVI